MSLALRAAPPNLSSAHNDVIFTVVDTAAVADPTSYPNFKYIADIYFGGDLVARIKRVPQPDTGMGIFSIGPAIRNYLALNFSPAANNILAQALGDGDFSVSITVRFGEEYNAILQPDLLVDSTRVYFNYYNGRLGAQTNKLISVQDKIASNRPFKTDTLLTSAWQFVPYFSTSTNPVQVTIRPLGGGAGFVYTFAPDVANEMIVLNLSPVAINAMTPGTITAATTSYQVQIGGQFFLFRLICEPIYQVYAIHFLNQYGGFETKLFNKASKSTYDVTRASFGKLAYTVDEAGAVHYKNASGIWNETDSVYSTQFQENLTLNTDILSDGEYRWLRDLIVSPWFTSKTAVRFTPLSSEKVRTMSRRPISMT
jgi:hypothetical protein